jgi:hypothetical protein
MAATRFSWRMWFGDKQVSQVSCLYSNLQYNTVCQFIDRMREVAQCEKYDHGSQFPGNPHL